MSVHDTSVLRHSPAAITLFLPDRAQRHGPDFELWAAASSCYKLEEGNVLCLIHDRSGPDGSALPVAPDVPFYRTPQGAVQFDQAKMEVHRPYPFKVNGVWFVFVKRGPEDGDVRLYQLA